MMVLDNLSQTRVPDDKGIPLDFEQVSKNDCNLPNNKYLTKKVTSNDMGI